MGLRHPRRPAPAADDPSDSTDQLSVVVADDRPLLTAGIRMALELDGGFRVLGEIHSGAALFVPVKRLRPDVLLFDPDLSGIRGSSVLARLVLELPSLKLVALGSASDRDDVRTAFRLGVCGYLLKTVPPRDLGAAVRQVVHGRAFTPGVEDAVGDDQILSAAGLSPREAEILRAVARGRPNKAIAQELWISEATVKFHLRNVYRRLRVTNRIEATRWLLDRGISVEAPATAAARPLTLAG